MRVNKLIINWNSDQEVSLNIVPDQEVIADMCLE